MHLSVHPPFLNVGHLVDIDYIHNKQTNTLPNTHKHKYTDSEYCLHPYKQMYTHIGNKQTIEEVQKQTNKQISKQILNQIKKAKNSQTKITTTLLSIQRI